MSSPRRIPALDRETAPIGLGCMGMSWAYTTPDTRDDDANIEVLHAALDLGITFLDTSDAYGIGHNEELLGRALGGRRDEAIVATKCGFVAGYADDGKLTLGKDARPERIRQACDDSLRRLGVDTVDLYYLHRVDPQVPLEDSWGTLAELVAAGKVRALGLSEVSVEQADRAHAIHPVSAIQSELSLWSRDPLGEGTTSDGDPAGDVVGWCREHDAIFAPFSPLGRGFLTGELTSADLADTDYRAGLPRYTGEAEQQNRRVVDVVKQVADRRGVPAAAVALAWVLARGEHVIPIPGTTKVSRLSQNLAAAELQLTAEDLAELDAAPAATGGRY